MRGKKLLFVGESWIKHTIHMKGFDHFVSVEYQEGAGVFLKCLDDQGFDVTYIRAHEVSTKFPTEAADLAAYDAVAISDIGANSFLLTDDTFLRSKIGPNRLQLIADFVAGGGGLVKIGGYMSFTGIDGRARYGMSPLAPILPVELLPYDDRIELPEGKLPEVVDAGHPITAGLGTHWPFMLGYNRTTAKPGASVLTTIGGDPLIAVCRHGAGRVVAFTSDVAPHWAPPEFLEWEHYPALWGQIVGWAAHGT
jgi:uncharacterized membrane protein